MSRGCIGPLLAAMLDNYLSPGVRGWKADDEGAEHARDLFSADIV